ncbi:MAG: hypothetical protein LC777_02355 [Actinobacteria bacterium]|nr:hypothetical protein [Actinomycetota bacterium]
MATKSNTSASKKFERPRLVREAAAVFPSRKPSRHLLADAGRVQLRPGPLVHAPGCLL